MLSTLWNRIIKKREGQKSNKKLEPPCAHEPNETTQDESNGYLAVDEPDGRQQPCPQCKAEKKALRTYRWKLILGLLLPYALQALDVTIIASALPTIAHYFGQIAQLNWIVAAFNLTSAAFIPFWGQIADIYGRHWALQSCCFLMLIGSAICTGGQPSAFGAFLFGRAVQGVGCAGLNTIIRVALADKVSLDENAKNWTIFTLVAGLSYGFGPAIGGALTSVSWRWCFAINLPIAVVSMVAIFFLLRDELLGPQPIPGLEASGARHRDRFTKRLATLDTGGQLTFLFGFGLIILAFTWAGASYAWNSAAVLVPLIVGAVTSCGWVYYEYLMAPGRALFRRLSFQKPMLPWRLVKDRNISILLYINLATGMAMYSVLYFVDLYFDLVKHYPPNEAGIQLLLYTPGLGAGVYISMFLCNTWPRQTFHPLFVGSVVEAVGVGLMAWALHLEHTPTIFGMIALTGAGTGLRFMPCTLHAIGFFPQDISSVVAIMGVASTFGGTMGLTIMSTVFNNVTPGDPKNGIVWAFVALTPFMVICILASACLGNVNITKDSTARTPSEEVADSNLTRGSYVLSLLSGEKPGKGSVDQESRELRFSRLPFDELETTSEHH
ncbi:major facilitator superfamily domain-containing protein [Biscogniauxia marginata]|nr:major facilitator superfamily domain-containing protein [Biscogniauxia marginata]